MRAISKFFLAALFVVLKLCRRFHCFHLSHPRPFPVKPIRGGRGEGHQDRRPVCVFKLVPTTQFLSVATASAWREKNTNKDPSFTE
jgi:hypothetical protein